MNVVLDSLVVHPAVLVEFLVVIGVAVKLRPDGNHKATTLLVHAVEHGLRIGEARRLKLVRAPLVLHPVVPVLHDVVDRNLALAELSECADDFIGGLVALTTLPEAQHPLRIDGSLTCQRAITRDNLVSILTSDEVVVHILRHLRPDAQAFLGTGAGRGTQATVADASVRLPLHAQLVAAALHQLFLELIGIGVPGRTPALRHHLFAPDIHLNISGIVEDEVKGRGDGRFDETLIDHSGTIEVEALRQVLDAARLRLPCQFGFLWGIELIIQRILLAHQRLAFRIGIGTCEVTLYPFLIVELKDAVQLLVVVRITKTSIGIGVPQHTIVLAGHDERYADLGIILEEVFVLAIHVQLLGLVLAQTIEIAWSAIKQEVPRQSVALFLRNLYNVDTYLTVRNTEGLEGLALLGLTDNHLTRSIVEQHLSCPLVDTRLDIGSLDTHQLSVGDLKLRLGGLLDDDQALLLR